MLSATIGEVVTRLWTQRTLPTYLLWPLSMIYCGWTVLRRTGYRVGILRAHRFDVPVVIVGNLTVGGTGKTPLVIWIAQQLGKHGFHPGIVARGYRGKTGPAPRAVTDGSDPRVVGDEPVLIARRSRCPVVVHADRVAAVVRLLEEYDCDVVVADDGLQHYRLARDIEVAVLDGERGFGNGFCLPAGPLREPASRVQDCDLRVVNGSGAGGLSMHLRVSRLVAVCDAARTCPVADFAGRKVHAVAGIGNPERFFTALEQAGLDVIRHPFPDHFRFTAADLHFRDALPTIMTEKDAVKCESFASADTWFAEAAIDVDPHLAVKLLTMLKTQDARS